MNSKTYCRIVPYGNILTLDLTGNRRDKLIEAVSCTMNKYYPMTENYHNSMYYHDEIKPYKEIIIDLRNPSADSITVIGGFLEIILTSLKETSILDLEIKEIYDEIIHAIDNPVVND